MKRTSKTGIFWGVSLIVIALLLILNAVGVKAGFLDIGGLPVLRIIIGGLCLAWAVFALVRGNVWQIFFPIGLVALLFEDEIARLFNAADPDLYSVWLVLGVSLLLTMGTYTLCSPHSKIEVGGGSDFNAEKKSGKANYSSAVKYIDCTDFTFRDVGNNLGSLVVFFENAERYSGDGTLYVNSNLGSATVYVPKNWSVDLQVDHNLGSCFAPHNTDECDTAVKIRVKNNLGKFSVVRAGEEDA